MPIMTGAHPLALPGGMNAVSSQDSPQSPLTAVDEKFIPKPRKPPKIRKRAFSPPQQGAAFKK